MRQPGFLLEEGGEERTGEVLAVPFLAWGREQVVPLLARASPPRGMQSSTRQALRREMDLAVPVRLLGWELAVPLPAGGASE